MKILIASDGSDFSIKAAQEACKLLNLTSNSEVLVVSVAEPVGPSSRFGGTDDYLVLARKASRGAASAAAADTKNVVTESLKDNNARVETEVMEGNPKSAIVDAAKRWNADLVVTGSHGRGFWGRMLIGSVSDAVVKHSHCSVLVVR